MFEPLAPPTELPTVPLKIELLHEVVLETLWVNPVAGSGPVGTMYSVAVMAFVPPPQILLPSVTLTGNPLHLEKIPDVYHPPRILFSAPFPWSLWPCPIGRSY